MKSASKVFQTKCRENSVNFGNFFLLSSFLKDPTQLKSKEESHFEFLSRIQWRCMPRSVEMDFYSKMFPYIFV